MRVNNCNGNAILINILLSVLLGCLMLWYFNDSNLFLVTAEMIGAYGLFYVVQHSNREVRKIILQIAGVVSFLMVLNHFMVANYGLTKIFFELFINLSIASLLILNRVNRKLFFILYIIYSIFCVFSVYGGDAQIMLRASRNYISIFLCILLLPYYSTFLKSNNERPSIIPIVVCLLVCIMSFGRGGILMAVLLLLFYSVISLSKNASKYQIILSLLVICIGYYFFSFTNFLDDYFYKFDLMGSTDEYREEIWTDYFNNISKDSFNLLLGFPLAHSSIISEYLNNLHNTYLMTHAYMGLLGLLFIYWGVIKGMFSLYKSKRWDLLSLIFVFMIRSFTDWTFPLQIGGIVFYYVMMVPIINKSQKR